MRLARIVLPARDPWKVARFWAPLLGGVPTAGSSGAVGVEPPGLPRLLFRPADGTEAGGGPFGFELEVPDVEAVRVRAARSGAIAVSRALEGEPGSRVYLADPEGNECAFVSLSAVRGGPEPDAGGRPSVIAKARVLFADRHGRVLLVRLRTSVAGHLWGLPGGTVEAGRETPRQAAVREIAEELGLGCDPARLLCVDWMNRTDDSPRMVHVFDGGILAESSLDRIRLDEAELAEWRLCTPHEAETLVSPAVWRQLREALAASAPGGAGPVELVDGVLSGSVVHARVDGGGNAPLWRAGGVLAE